MPVIAGRPVYIARDQSCAKFQQVGRFAEIFPKKLKEEWKSSNLYTIYILLFKIIKFTKFH